MEIKIKTKYNVGDKVFVFHQFVLFEAEIIYINFKDSIDKYGMRDLKVIYGLSNNNSNFEHEESEKYIYKNPQEYFSSVKILKFNVE